MPGLRPVMEILAALNGVLLSNFDLALYGKRLLPAALQKSFLYRFGVRHSIDIGGKHPVNIFYTLRIGAAKFPGIADNISLYIVFNAATGYNNAFAYIGRFACHRNHPEID